MNVLLAGATGLVGRAALDLFLAEPTCERVVALTRRPLPGPSHPKLENRVVDFDHLHNLDNLPHATHVVCALGTTMRQAGSRDAFRRVDYDYALALAQLGLAGGAHHYLLVSSLGADSRSMVFYSRVKGEVEAAIRALPYRAVTILRPSLLVGPREEFRLGERIAQALGRVIPAKYAPIAARDVAAGLVRAAREDAPGARVIESAELRAWATGG